MYENVYDAMVEEYWILIVQVAYQRSISWCSLKFLLFVDETGKNTNQKSDGQIGGQRYIVSVNGDTVRSLGLSMDLHFTVICFTAATGDPVMCTVIFTSEK
jgi:hypothetical protein